MEGAGLAPALGNTAASSAVGVGLGTRPAIVIGASPLAARDAILLQCVVAYVTAGGQDTPVDV